MALSGLVVASAMITVLAPTGKLDHSGTALHAVLASVHGRVLVVTGVPLLWRNLRRGSTKYLRLTPDGFELAQGWRSESGDWDR